MIQQAFADWHPRARVGSFGGRACRTLRHRLLTLGVTSLPPSFQASGWIIARIKATIPGADFIEIRKLYAEAARLSWETGIEHVVDHIVPLNHPRVCGLHVHYNLQVIAKKANGVKSNRWCPEQGELF